MMKLTYEVIIRRFRASMEPFWDLKISEYVVSYTYIQRIFYKLRVTFSDKYRWPNFTRSLCLHTVHVFPWIKKASFVLYIACMHV
jgi:hypothetical protein